MFFIAPFIGANDIYCILLGGAKQGILKVESFHRAFHMKMVEKNPENMSFLALFLV